MSIRSIRGDMPPCEKGCSMGIVANIKTRLCFLSISSCGPFFASSGEMRMASLPSATATAWPAARFPGTSVSFSSEKTGGVGGDFGFVLHDGGFNYWIHM